MRSRELPAFLTTSNWLAGVALWLGLLAAALSTPRVVRADGGAPVVAYVVGCGQNGQDLVTIDIASQRILAHTPIGAGPRAVATSGDGAYIYVAQQASNRVAILSASTLQVIAEAPAGPGPAGVVFDPWVTDDLFVVDGAGNTITVLDGLHVTPPHVLTSIQVGERPTAIALAGATSGIANPNDPEIYAANAGSDSVSVISVTRRQVIATIALPNAPLSVTVPAQGGVGYVGTRSGEILALDVARHQLLGPVLRLRGSAAGAMDYDAVTGDIYVPDAAGQLVDVLAPVSVSANGLASPLPMEPARTLPLSGGPSAVAVTADGAYGFVAQASSGELAMFDLAQHTIVTRFDVGGAPRAVVTGPVLPSNVPVPTVTSAATAAPGPGAAPGTQLLVYGALGLAVLAVAAAFAWWGVRLARARRS